MVHLIVFRELPTDFRSYEIIVLIGNEWTVAPQLTCEFRRWIKYRKLLTMGYVLFSIFYNQ